MQSMLRDGKLVPGNLESIIRTFESALNVGTANVDFQLTDPTMDSPAPAPTKPRARPKSRATESRLKSSTMDAVRGNRPKQRFCKFCGEPEHYITGCSSKNKYGHYVTIGKDRQTLHAELINTAKCSTDDFPEWKDQEGNSLFSGVPKGAKSLVIFGIYSYTPSNSMRGKVLAAKVSFLGEEASTMEGYENIGMAIANVIDVLSRSFSAKTKHVFIADGGAFAKLFDK